MLHRYCPLIRLKAVVKTAGVVAAFVLFRYALLTWTTPPATNDAASMSLSSFEESDRELLILQGALTESVDTAKSETTDLQISLPSFNGRNNSTSADFRTGFLGDENADLLRSHLTVFGKKRQQRVYLCIGISTIHRAAAGFLYLHKTINSLLDSTSVEEGRQIVLLIFAADSDQTKRNLVVRYLRTTYPKHLQSGFLQLMVVDAAVYPPLDGLKRNYGDTETRVKWRSKQVVDFALMFYYGRMLADYYLQIEDDVITVPHYLPEIRKCVEAQTESWTVLEFSELGFIGKLFKATDLERFARFLMLFYQEQPVDWLFAYFYRLQVQTKPILCKPSLFQHFGEHSSLISKSLNKLRDNHFAGGKNVDLRVDVPFVATRGSNPPAHLFSTIEVYQEYTPLKVYESLGDFFWGKTPHTNDTFTMVFSNAVGVRLKSVYVETGHPHQRNDFLRSGVLRASPMSGGIATMSSLEDLGGAVPFDALCRDFVEIGVFQEGKARVDNFTTFATELPFVRCFQILVVQTQEEWLIISQITVEQF